MVRKAVSALISVYGVGLEFSVTRDPETQLFVTLIRDRSTGVLIDQLPQEKLLKHAEALSARGV